MEILPSLSDIKRLRKKLNISQKTLGEKLKISQSIISRIESGTVDPPYSKLKRIYEYLENERKTREKSRKHAEDIMTQNFHSIKLNSTIRDAVELMNKYEIS
ncbi:MAG: helix-turn-helix domain-containing protein, partial [Candidatus Lokiarchaeota archaeon]|nr:helix-turn-helix domain-containing protein [Candidatus Lokiarchaeota archaeon]